MESDRRGGVVLVAAFSWAAGSVYSNRRPIRVSTLMAAGMQMLAGGILLLLLALVAGDLRTLESRQRVVDFDRRVFLPARVWLACWFHCLQLVTEQRHTRACRDLRVCESRRGGVLRLARSQVNHSPSKC